MSEYVQKKQKIPKGYAPVDLASDIKDGTLFTPPRQRAKTIDADRYRPAFRDIMYRNNIRGSPEVMSAFEKQYFTPWVNSLTDDKIEDQIMNYVNNPDKTNIKQFQQKFKNFKYKLGYADRDDKNDSQIQKLKAPDNQDKSFRPREILPGEKTGSEDQKISVADIVKADLWHYIAPNGDLGTNNSLFLDNRLNEAIRFSNPLFDPRHPDHDNTNCMGRIRIPQFVAPYPIEPAMGEIMFRAKNIAAAVNSYGSLSYTGGNNVHPDCKYKTTIVNDFVQVENLAPTFQKDITQTTPSAMVNYMKFRPYESKFREPLLRETSRGPDFSQPYQIYKEMTVGQLPCYGY